MMGSLRLCVESHLAVNLSNRLIDDIQQHLPAGGSMRTIQKKHTHFFSGPFYMDKIRCAANIAGLLGRGIPS